LDQEAKGRREMRKERVGIGGERKGEEERREGGGEKGRKRSKM
jgi:hypothetical protein